MRDTTDSHSAPPAKPIRVPTREAILEAALIALAQNPGASLSSIALQAGVGRATLHRYFASRSTLLRELMLMSIHEIDDAVEGFPETSTSACDLLERTIKAVIPLGNRFAFLSHEASLAADPAIAIAANRQNAEMAAIVEAAQNEGALDPATPTAWIVSTIDALVYTAWTAIAEGQIAAQSAPELVMHTLLNGFGCADRSASSN